MSIPFMLQLTPDFAKEISLRMSSGEPCWFPGLADMLIARFWNQPRTVDAAGYSTGAWLSEVPPSVRLAVPGQARMAIEGLPSAFHLRFNAPLFAASATATASAVARAIARLAPMGAGKAVADLVRSVHCVAARGRGYDCSHSEPSIPFSVFVSIPFGERHAELRLAESILHEAMHLQLTLIESYEPSVSREAASGYSPWQQSERPVQGLLHGLYVFAAIHQWLRCLATEPALLFDDCVYVDRRLREIEGEICAVRSLHQERGLTDFGRSMADWLLAPFCAVPATCLKTVQ